MAHRAVPRFNILQSQVSGSFLGQSPGGSWFPLVCKPGTTNIGTTICRESWQWDLSCKYRAWHCRINSNSGRTLGGEKNGLWTGFSPIDVDQPELTLTVGPDSYVIIFFLVCLCRPESLLSLAAGACRTVSQVFVLAWHAGGGLLLLCISSPEPCLRMSLFQSFALVASLSV